MIQEKHEEKQLKENAGAMIRQTIKILQRSASVAGGGETKKDD